MPAIPKLKILTSGNFDRPSYYSIANWPEVCFFARQNFPAWTAIYRMADEIGMTHEDCLKLLCVELTRQVQDLREAAMKTIPAPVLVVPVGSQWISEQPQNKKTMQNEIDKLHRQQLTLEILSCVLGNQLNGLPVGKILRLQKNLLQKSGSETMRIERAIEHLVKLRDRR